MLMKIFFLSLLLSFFFIGCDIFETRTPEPPNQGGSSFLPPTSVDMALTNLKNAISERNSTNYLRCFVDTLNSSRRFDYIPTSTALARFPTVFSRWTLRSEQSYFENLKAIMQTTATSSLTLTGSFQLVASDSAVYNADYQLTFQHGISGIPETVRGHLQFTLATDRNKIWSIFQWIDTSIGQEASWSELKGRFGN